MKHISLFNGMLDGLPEELDFTDRTQRIKEMGQAVCPPLVYEMIEQIHNS